MEIEQGKVLIAQPFLNDGDFKRTVILLTEHNEYGSMGFVVNRPLHIQLKDVLPAMPDLTQALYYGGPVAQNQLFFIHKKGKEIKNSLAISDNYFWGGDFEDVLKLCRAKKITKHEIKFFVGYSGWEPQQLEKEMEQKAWFVAGADYNNIMNEYSVEIWRNELNKLGNNYTVFTNFPDNPSLN